MSYDENTGKEPTCPICGLSEEEWHACKHLVAVIDLTYGDCYGGKVWERDAEFREIIGNSLIAHLKNGSAPVTRHSYLAKAWKWIQENFDSTEHRRCEDEYIDFDDISFWSFLEEVLTEAGAESLEGSWTDGIPLATSIYAMIFAKEPAKVVDMAMCNLREELGNITP